MASAGGSGGSGTAGSAGSVAGASGATGSGGFGGSGDAIADFVQAVDGVWLVGWSGGANHYSWMRFSLTTEGQGVLEVLDPTDVLSNIPFWNCQGVGSWNVAARENTLFLSLPKGCDPPAEAITFGPFEKIDRPGVLFRSAIEINSTPTFDNVEGFKVESSRCDAAFTVCEGPF